MNLRRFMPQDKPRAKKALWLMAKWGGAMVAVVLALSWLIPRPWILMPILAVASLVYLFKTIYEELDEKKEEDPMPHLSIWHHDPPKVREAILKAIKKNEKENEK